ncbi:MAG: hypothetical protein AAF497_19795 [Planctomycetota bacterium]
MLEFNSGQVVATRPRAGIWYVRESSDLQLRRDLESRPGDFNAISSVTGPLFGDDCDEGFQLTSSGDTPNVA